MKATIAVAWIEGEKAGTTENMKVDANGFETVEEYKSCDFMVNSIGARVCIPKVGRYEVVDVLRVE